ncbi:MAG: DUF5723 family protein [Crocinitomicaceae bacterium]|nr:DUF5723 family protein [Crocinitomicaceae bacterium]
MKVIQRILLLLVIVWSGEVNAQILPISYDTTVISHEILIDGGLDYYGSAIQNDLLSKFIKGGLITTDIKDNSFDRHKGVNRFGAIAGGEIEYRNYSKHLFKKHDWGYVIKAGYNVFGGLIYSKDLFGLAFYGNDRYTGETIDMSGTSFDLMIYQKIGFGFIHERTKSNISFNVYNISDRMSADFRDLELYQDANGDSLVLTMDGEVELKNSQKFNQGIGFGFDFDFKLPVAWGKDRKAFIRFEAKNVGFAYMYEDQKIYSFDTTIVFDGFTFDEIIGENSLFSDSLNLLDTLGINYNERTKTVMLPGFLQIGKIVDEHYAGKLQSFFGIRLYPTLIYSPYVYAGIDYKPAKWVRLGLNLSYGGFGGFRGGIYTSFTFNKYSVAIGSENLLGFFSKKISGQALSFKLRCAF